MAQGPARRVAIVTDAAPYLLPDLARLLAQRGHDLVVDDQIGGLADELTSLGAAVEVVTGVRDLAQPDAAEQLVKAALSRFGRIDAAAAFTSRLVLGSFVTSSVDDLRAVVTGCLEAPYNFLRAVVPVMVDQGAGQVLLFTSAAGARPGRDGAVYSAARAGATMLARNVAHEVVANGVQVNVIGTNFVEVVESWFVRDAESRARVEKQVPMGRLGTLEELAHLSFPFLDGTNRFTTGQFVAFAGGWV